MLDLRERHLDRIGVWAVRRDEDGAALALLEEAKHLRVLVKPEIVHHHDLAGAKRRAENSLNEVEEVVALHTSVDERVSADAVDVHGSDHGDATAARVRGLRGEEPLSDRSPPASRFHAGVAAGFVDEDGVLRVDLGLDVREEGLPRRRQLFREPGRRK